MTLRLSASSGLIALVAALACGTPQATGDGSGGSASDGSGGGADSDEGTTGGSTSGSGGTVSASGGTPSSGGASEGGASGGSAPEDARPSSGCGVTATPTDGLRSIDVDGTERQYILTLPDDYDPTRPYRLIFGFHGAKYDAEWVANGEEPLTGPYFGLADEAEGSAIFVAGQADGGWNSGDVTYVSAMLDTLEAELCVDTSRVFATGFSAGGIMTIRIGCALGDVFRAIAPMSPNLPSDCAGTDEPIAYWSSHGLSDTTITPEQGALARDAFLERNGCSETSMPASPEGCVSYEGCSAGHPVGYCTFDGVHEPAPFAGTAIWAFFSQF
jgi:polyhydroxybutyrate depolymerase